jgi:hypothetical protein
MMIDQGSIHQALPGKKVPGALRTQKKQRRQHRSEHANERAKCSRSSWRIADTQRGSNRKRQLRSLLCAFSGRCHRGLVVLAFLRLSRGRILLARFHQTLDQRRHTFHWPTRQGQKAGSVRCKTEIPCRDRSPSLFCKLGSGASCRNLIPKRAAPLQS